MSVNTTASDLVGLTEVAHIVSRSTVTAAQYTQRPDFPEPLRLARGRLWRRDEVELWARTTLPLPVGRPKGKEAS